jgi:hypothetical protein
MPACFFRRFAFLLSAGAAAARRAWLNEDERVSCSPSLPSLSAVGAWESMQASA